MRPVLACAVVLTLLAGCEEQTGQPADAGSLPMTVPASARAPFDMTHEIGVATAACVASEAQGPAALQSLRDKGYTAISYLGSVSYSKIAPGISLRTVQEITVRDANTKTACVIEVPRLEGPGRFAQVGASLRALGFAEVKRDRGFNTYAKDGLQLTLSGSQSSDSGMAQIQIQRDPAT